MTPDLNALREAAKRIAGEIWTRGAEHERMINIECGDEVIAKLEAQSFDPQYRIDLRARYLIAATPATILALLDRLEKAEGDAVYLSGVLEEMERLKRLLAIRDRQNAQLRKSWLSAAEKAIAGDIRDLRLRVDLANAPPVALVLSEKPS